MLIKTVINGCSKLNCNEKSIEEALMKYDRSGYSRYVSLNDTEESSDALLKFVWTALSTYNFTA